MDLDPGNYPKLHTRGIQIDTYEYRPDAVLLEGRLVDERFNPSHNLFGEYRPAGIVHDMTLRMVVGGPRLAIEALEARMDAVPNAECREALDSVQPLIGERITGGFTARVHQRIGGPAGCAHLVALARAMASAAIQGAYAAMSRKPPEGGVYLRRGLKEVINTCHIWRSDGPLMRRLERLMADRGPDRT